jgi:mannosyltransferase
MGQKTHSWRRGIFKHEKIRFGAVGVINTIVDFGILNLFVITLGLPLVTSNIVSTTAAMAVSFFLNKNTVFKSTGNARRQIMLFLVVTLAGIWIVQTCIVVWAYLLLNGLSPEVKLNVAKAIGIMFGLVWNYVWYSRVVFDDKSSISLASVLKSAEHHWKYIALGASIVALGIMMVIGTGRSVWFDEGYSIMVAQRPAHELVELTKVDAHPPLYYLYLKGWGTAFGWSELSLRLSSMIPMAASVGLMVVVLRRLFNVRLALFVAPFLAFAPFIIRYGFEIRMYSLVTLLAVIGTWVFIRAHTSKSKWLWLLYACIIALSMYVLYMSMVVWMAHALWLIYDDLRNKRNPIFRQRWLYYALAVLVFLPWLPVVRYQLDNSALPPYMTNVNFESFANLWFLMISYTPIWGANILLILCVLAIFAISGWLIVKIWRAADKNKQRGIVLLALGFVAAVIFYWYISLPPNPPRFVERYMVHVSIFFYAFVGVVAYLGYQAKQRIAALALGSLMLGLSLYGLVTMSIVGNYNYQRLQPTYAKTVKQAFGCNQTTFITSGAYGFIDMWYDFQGCDFRYFQPVDLTYIGGYAPINKLNTTARVKNSHGVSTKKVIFIYYDDSTEFMEFDSRYDQTGKIDYEGTHVKIYERTQ